MAAGVGSDGFGTKYRFRDEAAEELIGENIPIDFAKNCESLGAYVIKAATREAFSAALEEAKTIKNRPVCIVTETDRRERVGGYESWWDVSVAEVSDNPDVQQARKEYEESKQKEQHYL